ncbi:hypothetical protein Ctob_003485, partial [Chrysochromulina tobinii]
RRSDIQLTADAITCRSCSRPSQPFHALRIPSPRNADAAESSACWLRWRASDIATHVFIAARKL